MRQYNAVLVCKGVTYEALISDTLHSDDDLTFDVRGIKISVEFDGNLYIEDPGNYTKKQLAFLTSYPKHDALFLTNYHLIYRVPVTILNRTTNRSAKDSIVGEIIHKGASDNTVHYSYHLLNAKSSRTDIDYAIDELQHQLKDLYNICICGCCRYGQDHPYGGDVYLNYLCFKKSKQDYLQFPNGVGKLNWEFFIDAKNVESTRPFYSCEDFEARP